MSDALYDFYKIRSRLETIRKQHPSASEPILDFQTDDLTPLIERITQADPSQYTEIARSLTRHEATLLIHAYQRRLTDEAFASITSVLELRPLPRQLSQAWFVLRNHPDLSPLIDGMRAIAQAIKLPKGNADIHLDRIHHFWQSPDIYNALVIDLADTPLPLEQWAHDSWNADIRPDAAFPIYNRIQAAILVNGSREVLLRHPIHEIASWFNSVPNALYDDAAVNYINCLKESEWSDEIITSCVDRHGLPAAMGLFWSRVDKDKRLLIQRKVAAKLIGDFFDDVNDPEDRFDFWRHYVDQLIGITFPHSRSRVMLVFQKAVIVEFRDLGNAIYIYDRSDQGWVDRVVKGGGDNSSCKDIDRAITKVSHFRNWRQNMDYYMGQLT